ncbi:MAG: putative ABC transporter permease subunit [Gemmatimonadaceae bacterium]
MSSTLEPTEFGATLPPRVSGSQRTVTVLPDPPLLHLLLPKWLTARARTMQGEKGRGVRFAILGFTGFLFWAFVFGVLWRLLTYFRGVDEIGQLLAGKLLGLILLGFSSILLLSNVITALSSFFLAKDLDMLVAGPVDWLRLYGAKLLETVIASSWMVFLVSIPMFSAYGFVYDGGVLFPLFVVAVMLPLFIIPAVVGSALTLTLVNVFPARRTRDILSVIAVLAAGGIVLLFRLIRPEQLARPEGFRNLVDFIAVLRTPTSPLLPSEWVQKATMGFLDGQTDWLAVYLLWTTAAAAVVLGALLHRWLYLTGFSKAQESSQRFVRGGGALASFGRWVLTPFGVLRRELVLKELRLFFRDTTQWSQLILLAVLVVVYVFNIKYLPLRGEGITFFLVNVVPFLNLVLAGFVLASIAARFIFPGVSLEGRTLWLLRSSPMHVRDLLWAKFWVGTMPLLILAVSIVGVTDYLLQVSDFMFFVSVASITMITFALAGLAIGFGTMFPQFETENAAQIPTSFGGLLYMMASVVVIGGVVVLEAVPVYDYLSAKLANQEADPTQMVIWFAAAALLCILATVVPIRLALKRLEAVER